MCRLYVVCPMIELRRKHHKRHTECAYNNYGGSLWLTAIITTKRRLKNISAPAACRMWPWMRPGAACYRTGHPSKAWISSFQRRADRLAGRCQGPAVSLGRRAKTILEKLVHGRRPAEPRPLGAAFRGEFSRPVRVRLRRAGRSGTASGRGAFPAPGEIIWVCGRAAFGVSGTCADDIAPLGHAGHAHGQVPPLRPAVG